MSEEQNVYQENEGQTTNEAPVPSVLSTLPVALVVEQTARILEDIKRKIQQQKEEEERLRQEQLKQKSESPTYFPITITRPVLAPAAKSFSSDEGIFSATKSFIVINHHQDNDNWANSSKTISPLNHTSIPRSLSPDSGTEYPFSASSSISPPFMTSIAKGTSSDCVKLSHNSDDEIFKPISTFSPFVPTATPKYSTISPTTSLTSIYSSRRLSGTSKQHSSTTASLAKSTPSISMDLINECTSVEKRIPAAPTEDRHHHHHHQRPLSFQVLQSNFNFDTKSINTYHEVHTSTDPVGSSTRYRSLANLVLANPVISSATPIISASTAVAASSQFSGLLNSNNRFSFGDPLAIKPVVSALEYQLPKPSNEVKTKDLPIKLDKQVKALDESYAKLTTLDKYNKYVEKQKLQLELNEKKQQADYLSLSLSPPIGRRNKDLTLKGAASL